MKRWSRVARGGGLMLGMGFAAGCDAQADPTYRGDPLVTVQGQVEAALGTEEVVVGVLWLTGGGPACGGASVAVQCSVEASGLEPTDPECIAACGEPSCDDLEALASFEECASACGGETGFSINVTQNVCFSGAMGQTTPVVGDFPAQFTLDILEPPPDAALTPSDTGERVVFGVFVALSPGGAPWVLESGHLPPFPDWLLGGSDSHALLYAADPVTPSSSWGRLLNGAFDAGYQLMEAAPEDEGVGLRPSLPNSESSIRMRIAPPDSIAWPFAQP